MIKVIEVSSGVKSDADCTDRKKPVRVSDGNALHEGMNPWVKLV